MNPEDPTSQRQTLTRIILLCCKMTGPVEATPCKFPRCVKQRQAAAVDPKKHEDWDGILTPGRYVHACPLSWYKGHVFGRSAVFLSWGSGPAE